MMTKSTTNALKCRTSALIFGTRISAAAQQINHQEAHTHTAIHTPRLMLIEMHGLARRLSFFQLYVFIEMVLPNIFGLK